MPSCFDELCVEWQNCLSDASISPRLLLLKQFRDDFQCLPELQTALLNDFSSVLRERYPPLRIQDVYLFLTNKLHLSLGESPIPSDEALRLKDALLIDSKMRHYFRSIAPLDHGWRSWRRSQIQRFDREDVSARSSQIMHIPFAIELTQGCSGGCSFCGLSASYLSTVRASSEATYESFTDFLLKMRDFHGEFGQCGVLYWASDPLDCPEYLDYARIFFKVFNTWPSTTTALAEKFPDRFRELLSTGILNRPWAVRCSLRNKDAYYKIQKNTSLSERFGIVFIPQFAADRLVQANAGRLYSPISETDQNQKGATIACMSGLLVNMVQQSIQLVTPCLAEPNHRDGYRSLLKAEIDSISNLTKYATEFISKLPLLPIKATDKLSVAVHSSQFHLYERDDCFGVLSLLAKSSLTLQQLTPLVPDSVTQLSLFTYCIEMMQYGVIYVSE